LNLLVIGHAFDINRCPAKGPKGLSLGFWELCPFRVNASLYEWAGWF